MSDHTPPDFAEFLRQREIAARAFINGDFRPSRRLLTTEAPATFFDPWGGCHAGPEQVLECYERNASLFAWGSCSFQTLHVAANDSIGYWVFIQRGEVRLQGTVEPFPGRLRVTEIFRREDGQWKLIHRHADALDRE